MRRADLVYTTVVDVCTYCIYTEWCSRIERRYILVDSFEWRNNRDGIAYIVHAIEENNIEILLVMGSSRVVRSPKDFVPVTREEDQ